MKRVLPFSAILALLGAHSLFYPPGRDQGTFLYMGWQMLEGKLPYIDLWDVKPPAIHIVYAVSELVFGHNTWGIRALDLIWQVLTALAILAFATRHYESRLPGIAGAIIYVFTYFRYDYWNTAQPDGMMNLFIALGFLLATGTRQALWFLSGAAVGIAFWFKYPAGAFILPLLALLIGHKKRTPVLWGAAGFAASITAGALLLACFGMLRPLVSTLLQTVTGYTASGLSSLAYAKRILLQISSFDIPFGSSAPLWFFALVALISSERDSPFEPLLILAGLICTAVQGKIFPYHALPLVFALSLTAGHGFAIAWASAKRFPVRRALFYLLVCLMTLDGLYFRLVCASAGIRSLNRYGSILPAYVVLAKDANDKNAFKVAEYIRERTAPDDTIYIWGFEPLIYYLSERRCPSRFIYNTPLFGAFHRPGNRTELLEDLKRAAPAYMIVVRGDVLEYVTGTRMDSYGALSAFPELKGFIERNYEPERTIANFIILSRTRPTAR